MSENGTGKGVVVVGLDPGMTTGLCRMTGSLGDTFGSGKWDVVLSQLSVDSLFVIGCDYVEASWRDTDSWWVKASVAGVGLCMHVLDAGPSLVVCEDFVLRPSAAAEGIGGREVLVPVAITAGFTSMITQMVERQAVEVMYSSPSAKAVMTSARLQRWFGDVGRGKPHATDALRHACLGIRRIR